MTRPRPSGEGTCRTCGALVLWVRMEATGKRMPLDAVPAVGGTIARGRIGGVWLGRVIPTAERGERPLYVSHFATCPQAGSHRRKREDSTGAQQSA